MRWAAPWYLHPAEFPEPWRQLCAAELDLAFAVINVHNGPGVGPDPYYDHALQDGCKTPLVGYVFAAYGQRSRLEIRADARRWHDLYGVTAVLVDGVPPSPSGLWDLGVIEQLRRDGANRVLTNPGMASDGDLIAASDVTCVAEYGWGDYRSLRYPGRPSQTATDCWPPDRVWHLVHSVPPAELDAASREVESRGPGFGWITDGEWPNPWGRLPSAHRGGPTLGRPHPR